MKKKPLGAVIDGPQPPPAVTITGEEYWKLVAMDRQVKLAQQEADLYVKQALAAKEALLRELDEKYPAFNPKKAFTARQNGPDYELVEA